MTARDTILCLLDEASGDGWLADSTKGAADILAALDRAGWSLVRKDLLQLLRALATPQPANTTTESEIHQAMTTARTAIEADLREPGQ